MRPQQRRGLVQDAKPHLAVAGDRVGRPPGPVAGDEGLDHAAPGSAASIVRCGRPSAVARATHGSGEQRERSAAAARVVPEPHGHADHVVAGVPEAATALSTPPLMATATRRASRAARPVAQARGVPGLERWATASPARLAHDSGRARRGRRRGRQPRAAAPRRGSPAARRAGCRCATRRPGSASAAAGDAQQPHQVAALGAPGLPRGRDHRPGADGCSGDARPGR
jgi:hypothetical protein